MKKFLFVLTYLLTAVLASLITVTVFLRNYGGYSKLSQLEDLIENYYAEDVDLKELEDAAAHAMVGALGDRWSYYIPASQLEGFNQNKRNEYVGIGVTVSAHDEGIGLLITAVTSGGPAEEAGLEAGDVIIEADKTSLAGMTAADAGELIKGEAGTGVKLKLLRGTEEIEVDVQRREIQTIVAMGTMLEDNIGLVTVDNFNTNCYAECKAAIEDLLDMGAEKLIFDVRNNGGGYASEMVNILDYLLPEGQLFKMVNFAGVEEVNMSDANCLPIPMAVLVNGGSYSAAECFAAALKEYDAAFVVGEKTSGKGYYQVVYTLRDGSAVGLSIGKYYTPHNNNLEGVGLMPDYPVPVDEKTAAAIKAGTLNPLEDPQIVKALELLKAK